MLSLGSVTRYYTYKIIWDYVAQVAAVVEEWAKDDHGRRWQEGP